jgi:hypothetical protein
MKKQSKNMDKFFGGSHGNINATAAHRTLLAQLRMKRYSLDLLGMYMCIYGYVCTYMCVYFFSYVCVCMYRDVYMYIYSRGHFQRDD